MWTARISPFSENREYNYFKDTCGYIGHENTLQELIDYIRNPENSYKNLHLENTTGTDGEANPDGVKYYLTIKSLLFGSRVEFEIYDLDDIDSCNECAKYDLMQAREYCKMAKYREEISDMQNKIEWCRKEMVKAEQRLKEIQMSA